MCNFFNIRSTNPRVIRNFFLFFIFCYFRKKHGNLFEAVRQRRDWSTYKTLVGNKTSRSSVPGILEMRGRNHTLTRRVVFFHLPEVSKPGDLHILNCAKFSTDEIAWRSKRKNDELKSWSSQALLPYSALRFPEFSTFFNLYTTMKIKLNKLVENHRHRKLLKIFSNLYC